jgi:hypothetical protein
MWELIVIAAGFVVVSACVIALARSSTARWERERRAARAPRRVAIAPITPATGAAARLRRALARTAATAGRAAAPIRIPIEAAGRILVASRQQVARRVRPVPQMWDALRDAVQGDRPDPDLSRTRADDPSIDGRQASGTVPRLPEPSREAPARRGRGAGHTAHHFSRAFPRLTHRLRTRLVHRHDQSRDPHAGRP